MYKTILLLGLIFSTNILHSQTQMTYKTFDGKTLSLFGWSGNKMMLLSNSNSLDKETMKKLVLTLDTAYNYYAKCTGREPMANTNTFINNLSTLAEVSNTCGAGCGYLGFTGIEMIDTYFQNMYNGVYKNNQFDQVPFYELGRNFWFYSPQLAYKENDPIVTGYAVFMRFVAMEATKVNGGPFNNWTFDEFKSNVKDLLYQYQKDPNLTWENTLGKGKGLTIYGLGATDLFASFCFYLKERFSNNNWVENVWKFAGKRPAANSTQDAVDNFVIASSQAANQNLVSLFEEWRWPISTNAKLYIEGLNLGFQLSSAKFLCESNKSANYTISNVKSTSECTTNSWLAKSSTEWIKTDSKGICTGLVNIIVSENNSDCPRVGYVTINDVLQIEVSQPGKNNNLGCAYSKSNWVLQNAKLQNESNPILTIKPTSQTNVWAPVKGSNLYVRTEDGGNTWENGAVTGATEYQFASFFALNKDTAWAPMFFKTGSKGDLFYTVNGGKTWSKSDATLFKNASSFPNFMHFFDKQNGVVIGDPVNNQHEIYITKDGGKTWVETNSPQSVDKEYPVINRYSTYKNNIWFVTTKGRVFKSSDKGVKWESYDIDKINLTYYLSNINIKFKDSLVGFSLNDLNLNYKTIDGGKTWKKVNNFISPNSIFDGDNLVYVPGNKDVEGRWVWSQNYYRGAFYSVNDGEDWVNFDTLSKLTTFGFYDITHGWSATYNSYNSKYPKMYALNACAPKAPVSYSLMSDTTKLFYFSDSYKPCSKQEFALFAKGKGVIRWYDQSIGGNLLSSEASIQKQDIPFQSGKSTIYVQDSTCYVSARSSLTIVQNDDVNCVANINSVLYSNLNIYPNPSTGNFTISNAPIGVYTIVDELGKVIHQFDVKEAEDQKVQALQLSKGVYFLRGSKEHFVQEKIVVIK
ncbi:MAG: T9SS type A sorting domain-containing protein [Bacteroidia bacterium]|nr:T9SS type A sorting domain-containing protein [Bacteroidia bacterium]